MNTLKQQISIKSNWYIYICLCMCKRTYIYIHIYASPTICVFFICCTFMLGSSYIYCLDHFHICAPLHSLSNRCAPSARPASCQEASVHVARQAGWKDVLTGDRDGTLGFRAPMGALSGPRRSPGGVRCILGLLWIRGLIEQDTNTLRVDLTTRH